MCTAGTFYILPFLFFFFFNDTATTEIYTLSLHDALPIWRRRLERLVFRPLRHRDERPRGVPRPLPQSPCALGRKMARIAAHGDPYAGRLERPFPGEPRQRRADGAARVRERGSDERRVRLARARRGARGFQALHDVRGHRDPPGDAHRGSLALAVAGRERGASVMKPKQHLEFVAVDLGSGWETPPGYAPGFYQKILASDLDEKAKKGSRTR